MKPSGIGAVAVRTGLRNIRVRDRLVSRQGVYLSLSVSVLFECLLCL